LQERCSIQPQKKHNVARFSQKRYRIDQLRVQMGTDEYRKLTNSQAGIEGLPSGVAAAIQDRRDAGPGIPAC
jgi:hypothetical protein